MKISNLFIVANLFAYCAAAQEMVLDLNGFRLGGYREAVRKEFGDPFKSDKFSDGFEYEIYLLKPDTSLYMIFEYSPDDLRVIWSMQITGKSGGTGFKSLQLGMDRSDVERILGTPMRKEDVGEYGSKWEYHARNYSIEINTEGKLSSVKLTDSSAEMFPNVEVQKLPVFDQVVKVLTSGKNEEVEKILSPDIEVYVADSTYSFGRRISEEVKNDISGLFALIRGLSSDLGKVNTSDAEQYEETVRLMRGRNPMHVIKIKKGSRIREIVFKYMFGRYLIWEIRA